VSGPTHSRKRGPPATRGRALELRCTVKQEATIVGGTSMGNALRSVLIRLVAYVAVAIAAGLLFLAGATVYELMWPRPVAPLSQMSRP
jgi:hypothetical protein